MKAAILPSTPYSEVTSVTQRSTWNFYTAGRLIFGPGAVNKIAAAVRPSKIERCLIVTDSTLVKVGLLDKVRKPLTQAGFTVEVFDGGEPEPSINVARESVAAARRFQPDGIIGLGGSSNMDVAKITANVITHGGELEDYLGWNCVPGPTIPLICVPTTSGTGSEVSHAAVLTDTENQMKVSTLSNFLRPSVAVVDPEMTLTCPAKTTADSGIDALTHAIEAYTAIDYRDLKVPADEEFPYEGRFPLGEVLAEKAIRLISEHLRTAVAQPENREAREGMALAATIAGMAFSNCAVALVHALEYPLGGALHCSHGAGNGLLLPYVMRFNRPTRGPAFARIAELMGENTSGLTQDQAAERAIELVEQLRNDIGIPQRISQIGGTADQLPEFAEKSFSITRLMLLNPREPTESDLLDILRSAL